MEYTPHLLTKVYRGCFVQTIQLTRYNQSNMEIYLVNDILKTCVHGPLVLENTLPLFIIICIIIFISLHFFIPSHIDDQNYKPLSVIQLKT